MVKWYHRIGNTIELYVNSKWEKGKIVDGDGFINVQSEDGEKYLCFYCKEGENYRKCDDSLGDLITNADRIRSMSDEELAEFLCCVYDEEECFGKFINGIVIQNYDEDRIAEWLKSEVKE